MAVDHLYRGVHFMRYRTVLLITVKLGMNLLVGGFVSFKILKDTEMMEKLLR